MVRRFFVTTLALILTAGLVFAQQDRQQQDRAQQDRYGQQDRTQQQGGMHGTRMSPKGWACAHGYGMDGSGQNGKGMGMGQGQGMGMGMMGMHGGTGGNQMGMFDFGEPMGYNPTLVLIYHSDMFNLSEQQVQELQDMYVRDQEATIDAWANVAKARLQLNRLLMDEQAPEEEVTQAIDEMANSFADFFSMKYRQRQEVYSVLSPEQREDFENFREMQFGQVDQMSGMGQMNGNRNNGQNEQQKDKSGSSR